MKGLMQDWPLLAHKVIDHAALNHPKREVISRAVEGGLHHTNYKEIHSRALKIAQTLEKDGYKLGDRIATLAWNTWRHLETWYGIMGIGAIYHTLNPRLFPEQIAWIMNDAEDKLLFVDLSFIPIVEAIADKVPSLERIIVFCEEKNLPESRLELIAYESWIEGVDGDFKWHEFDETTAAGMCYTSGTTGNPKGVVYSHRSNVLHGLASNQKDMLGLASSDRLMPVVPLFHANAWSTSFSAPMVGATLVYPGAQMDGASIYEILSVAKVNITAAVPTVWLMLLDYLEKENVTLPDLEKVIIGGAACPQSMIEAFQDKYDVQVLHAWGMTEMSPLGTICSHKPEVASMDKDAQMATTIKQGHAPFTVEMKITDDENNELPWDGKTFGRLKVRGPAIASSYFKDRGQENFDDDLYFDTGDVSTIDENGYMQITDRSKDVIKSGGEWISTIDLENLAVGHPDVMEAAVIGIAHPKWDERPLLIIVPKEGKNPSGDDILAFMEGKIAKWWMPNAVEFVDEIPHTATGKIQKIELRKKFLDYRFKE